MDELLRKAQLGKQAAHRTAGISTATKNDALAAIAEQLERDEQLILQANQRDLEAGERHGTSSALLDRLALTPERLIGIREGVSQIAGLADPVGEILASWRLPNGIEMRKVRVPLGLLGIIYEARPNVTVDAATLCLKTGNAVLLRGSSTAIESNKALVASIRAALTKAGIDENAVQLVEDPDRETVARMLTLNKLLDVVIPRGGASLIEYVVKNSTVPVLETGAGNCHVYVHADADPGMAERIVVNAKTHRPSVCNAAETLLVHESFAKDHLQALVDALREKKVECRGCEGSRAIVPDLLPATNEDWDTEYLDFIIAIRVVDSVDQAIEHINRHGTRHSEAIVAREGHAIDQFLARVDAAAVYHNASTRFTDGFEYGFGAEIGISTQKLHARGPMGLPELTSYKYLASGTGQVRE